KLRFVQKEKRTPARWALFMQISLLLTTLPGTLMTMVCYATGTSEYDPVKFGEGVELSPYALSTLLFNIHESIYVALYAQAFTNLLKAHEVPSAPFNTLIYAFDTILTLVSLTAATARFGYLAQSPGNKAWSVAPYQEGYDPGAAVWSFVMFGSIGILWALRTILESRRRMDRDLGIFGLVLGAVYVSSYFFARFVHMHPLVQNLRTMVYSTYLFAGYLIQEPFFSRLTPTAAYTPDPAAAKNRQERRAGEKEAEKKSKGKKSN
ncbi:hypothetical protein HDU93_001910, partial [Gonapodya sp. JEL0774]